MDQQALETFDRSLERCNASPAFLDRFYAIFMASSPKVKEKFAHTDFARQNMALRESLKAMSLAARDPKTGPERLLSRLAERHSWRIIDQCPRLQPASGLLNRHPYHIGRFPIRREHNVHLAAAL